MERIMKKNLWICVIALAMVAGCTELNDKDRAAVDAAHQAAAESKQQSLEAATAARDAAAAANEAAREAAEAAAAANKAAKAAEAAGTKADKIFREGQNK